METHENEITGRASSEEESLHANVDDEYREDSEEEALDEEKEQEALETLSVKSDGTEDSSQLLLRDRKIVPQQSFRARLEYENDALGEYAEISDFVVLGGEVEEYEDLEEDEEPEIQEYQKKRKRISKKEISSLKHSTQRSGSNLRRIIVDSDDEDE